MYPAAECADDVTSIALELGARRDEPQHAVDRRIAFRKEEARRQTEWIKALNRRPAYHLLRTPGKPGVGPSRRRVRDRSLEADGNIKQFALKLIF
jgi:hypothetical protein